MTTVSLATNPRLVKEVDLALSLSYRVSIVAFRFDNWSASLNEQIINRYRQRVHYVEIAAGRRPLFPWLFSSVLHQCCLVLAKAGLHYPFILSQALQKRTVLLLNALKKLRQPADLIVAHNPGSFYPVMQWAKRRKILYGIDVEDYHSGETNDKIAAAWMRRLMVQTIPGAAYVTAAAPLILDYVKRDCGTPFPPAAVVLNYFHSDEFCPPVSAAADGPLRLVWFSQYIAAGRGLEMVIEVIRRISGVQLHLYGQPDNRFVKNILESVENVFVHGPIEQKELHMQLASYDIGLAIEDASSNLNRDLCITNKLLAYKQAGLIILMTATSAQKKMAQQYPEQCVLVDFELQSLISALNYIKGKKSEIGKLKQEFFNLSANENSKTELDKLCSIWSVVL